MRRLFTALGTLAAAATLALAPVGAAQATPAAPAAPTAPAVAAVPFGCGYLVGPALITTHPIWCLGHPVTVLHPGQVRFSPFHHVHYVA
ncbi:hypothetical protein [Streptomyces antimicrobicus]|uniref:Chaplin domain-containing protein n=1 Tax=Streptomyces antimicrobicus TaxID=2883108 RepID=A0ABS8BCQ2_9ACTN|nr:hypothetical protein [Streptomyces antimicrobicus]MCB5182419.1 hypothetical protein [Streptomyces antimicrobicus]